MKTYRVGIIGCGSIAHLHAAGYEAVRDRVEIVALADPAAEALEAFGSRHGVDRH